jgi:YhcH/YjgK/YiaL family protein
MIYDTLAHLDAYRGVHPGVMKALELLRDTDFSQWEVGRHDIDGDKLYLMVQSYDTKVENDRPEAHRKYIDIQMLLSGQEWMGVGPLEDMTEEVEAKPEGDIWFYHGELSRVLLKGSRFTVLFPGDAHAPCIAVDGKPIPCRKCVVKVLADWNA